MKKRVDMKRRAGQIIAADILMDAYTQYEANKEHIKKRRELGGQSSEEKPKSPQVVESPGGSRYRATYSQTFDSWTLVPLGLKYTGKKGRPKQGRTYDVAFTYFNFRRQGWKYEAAIAAVAEIYGITTRTVIRRWNANKHRFKQYEGFLAITKERLGE